MVNATWSESAMNIVRLGRQSKETYRIGRVARLLDRAAR